MAEWDEEYGGNFLDLGTTSDAYDFLENYNFEDDYTSESKKDEVELSFRYCYQSTILGGHVLLFVSYLIASFIYFNTFNKSLRWYLILKCAVVIISSTASFAANAVAYLTFENDYYDLGFYKFRIALEKVVIVGRFLVFNLNFLFQYDIYCMVCQTVKFSENLAVKLLAALFFAFLPAASTFRYAKTDVIKQAEELGLEIGYHGILFLFMVFFILKIRKAFAKSVEIRSSSTAASSADQRRLKKIFYFLIIMAIIHLLYTSPRILYFAIHVTIAKVFARCDALGDGCLSTISHLSCISYAKDVMHICIAFLDLFPFLLFVKFYKFSCCK